MSFVLELKRRYVYGSSVLVLMERVVRKASCGLLVCEFLSEESVGSWSFEEDV